jgi:hypothetical protein
MTKYAFVLEERHRAGWSSTRKVAEAVGAPVGELGARLRPWALEIIAGKLLDDGEYAATLVELREDGHHKNGLPVEFENILWFHGEEHVPASTVVSPARA